MKRLIVLLAAVAAAVAPQAAWTAAESASPTPPQTNRIANPEDLFADTVVARGKGCEIKRAQLDEALVSIKASAAASGRSIPPEQMNMFEQQILDRMIQIQLLLTKATDADRATGKETSSKRFDEMKTKAGSEETLNRQIKSVGLTLDELRARMVEEATAQVTVERELKISVSDDEIKKYYDDNPSKFEQPEMVKVSHILLSTRDSGTQGELSEDKKQAKRKLAEDLLKRARAGEDFAKLAKEYSDDTASKDSGGEYPPFQRGRMVAEFDAAAFALKPNEISDVVTTMYGYHIIKLLERIPAQKVELAKVSTEVKDYLKGQALQKLLPDYMAKLKKEANVQILDERLKPADSADSGVVPAAHPPATSSATNKTQ
jgi:peptidyl-prolyl cis-trans isomerase C